MTTCQGSSTHPKTHETLMVTVTLEQQAFKKIRSKEIQVKKYVDHLNTRLLGLSVSKLLVYHAQRLCSELQLTEKEHDLAETFIEAFHVALQSLETKYDPYEDVVHVMIEYDSGLPERCHDDYEY